MDENHALLYRYGVSSPELEQAGLGSAEWQVRKARSCAEVGEAVILALVDEAQAHVVAKKLAQVGQCGPIITTIQSPERS